MHHMFVRVRFSSGTSEPRGFYYSIWSRVPRKRHRLSSLVHKVPSSQRYSESGRQSYRLVGAVTG
eukprot:123926-Pyramimonas_sp.AAC.2